MEVTDSPLSMQRRIGVPVAIACLTLALSAPSGRASPRPGLGIFQRQTDVGITPMRGSVVADPAADTYTVTGGGANMWGATDAFHFVWRRWTGDVTITAQVKIITASGNPHRKAGLMVRQGLGPGDAFADALLHGVGLMALQYRETARANTLEVVSPISSPQVIRLERRGNTFILFVAGGDGQLKTVGSAVVELHDPVYIGLAVCSHDANALTTARFTRVEISKAGVDMPVRAPTVPRRK
ncbi:MAG: hypothetical protein ACRD3D_14570 [Terriglobia bacterium]